MTKPIINRLLDELRVKLYSQNNSIDNIDAMVLIINLKDQISEMQKHLLKLYNYVQNMPCETHINKDNCDTYCENMKYIPLYYQKEGE